jgi:hypothetical protein
MLSGVEGESTFMFFADAPQETLIELKKQYIRKEYLMTKKMSEVNQAVQFLQIN